ncbi:MAG: hypothetical protein E4H03_07780 [Myxococcales bacterium]|nr:MAG: hypothetical protein E4H03_07780 [Myxococcales bacterium]
MRHTFATVAVTATIIALVGLPVHAQMQTKRQQGCINALNKSGAKVAQTQGKENAACVKNAGKGKEADAGACLTADTKLKVSKAKGKTTAADTKKCAETPSFGRAAVSQINTAAGGQEVALVEDVFGSDLTAAIIEAAADKTGAGCQAAVSKTFAKIAATKIKTFLKCKKTGLNDGSITSPATLEDCFDTVAADAKVDKAIAKLATTVTSKCGGVDLDVAFPGDCIGAGVFADCVDAAVECRVCLTLDAMDNLGRDCDLFDNGAADLSCATLPTTTTTSSTTTSSTSTTTLPPGPDWGLGCFTAMDCGSSFCPAVGCQCDAFLDGIGLTGAVAMCFFDCMDSGLMDVTDCRDSCGGSAAPVCDASVAGGGGFTGAVTGPGACTPSGFAMVGGTPSFGGSASELKRLIIDFATPIDESTLFTGPPPPCAGSCPSPGTDCDAGAPYPETTLADHFRLQIGVAAPPDDVCTRSGVPTTVCKFSPSGYALVLDAPICSSPVPVDVTMFMSCHVSDAGGGTFLHYSTGDFFSSTTWPP